MRIEILILKQISWKVSKWIERAAITGVSEDASIDAFSEQLMPKRAIGSFNWL